jgi:hypothetical protein
MNIDDWITTIKESTPEEIDWYVKLLVDIENLSWWDHVDTIIERISMPLCGALLLLTPVSIYLSWS